MVQVADSPCYFDLGELIIHSSGSSLVEQCGHVHGDHAARSPCSGLVRVQSPAAIAARETAAAMPSADLCFGHSPYSNPISSPNLQVFTTYFTMLVNIYWFFSVRVLYLVVLLL